MSADDFMDGKRLRPNSSLTKIEAEDLRNIENAKKKTEFLTGSNVETASRLLECHHLANYIAKHEMRGVILVQIFQQILSDIEAVEVLELVVNESVIRSPHVDTSLTQLLDIKLKE